jgi:uncharacterized delta-60 repeat protein
MNRVFLAALMAVFLVSGASAAPGDLDTTFGGGKGWVSTGFLGQSSDNGANSAVQQTDGKLVVVGYSESGNGLDFSLMRYNADGSLDDGFGNGGKVSTAIGSGTDVANSVIQQADAKLVAAGYSRIGTTDDFALVRYNLDGTLDTGFGVGGIVTTVISTTTDIANSVFQQTDGKLVVAGYSRIGSTDDFTLVRFNANGSLDSSFGTGGKVTTAVGTSNDYAYSVIQLADGKLVAAGYSRIGSTDDFTLVRYNANGSLDSSFGTGGKVTTAIGASNDYAYSVIQLADGKLVAAGYSRIGSADDFTLVRYNTDGNLDTGFGVGGIVTTNFIGSGFGSSDDKAYSVIQQADGMLVAAGNSDSSNDNFALARYNLDGTLDTGFGEGGKIATPISSKDDSAKWVLQQADGKLLAVGKNTTNSTGLQDAVLVRYSLDGALDTTFNTTGKVTTDSTTSYDESHSVIQQADGKLVVAGSTITGNFNYDFGLVRYNPDGTLDTAFATNGKATTDIGASNDYAYSVIQQTDSQLVVAGYSDSGNGLDFALVRYKPDGTLDASFGTNGKVTTAVGTSNDYAYSVIQLADGKLVVVGYSRIGSTDDFALMRYNADGTIDTSFGMGGKVTTDINNNDDKAYSVLQQADGKLVAVGVSGIGTNVDFALVRYNENGTLDNSFGLAGKVITAFGTSDDIAYSVSQQVDGKLVAAGKKGSTFGFSEFALARYNEDGTLDSGFGSGGRVTAAIGVNGSAARSVIQQADGKLVAAGESNSISDFTLVRYNTDGTLDNNFGASGKVITAIGGSNSDVATSVIQQADGNLAVAGYSSGMPTGKEFVVACFESGQTNTDGDAIMDALDSDDDNDGVLDINDAFTLDATETVDTDGDGIGNNADTDDDNDTLPDLWEQANGHDPLKADYMVSAGGYHSCALDNDGVKCWGSNSFGQAAVPALTAPTMVSAGYRHTCAIDATGVKCWGKGTTNTGTLDNFGQSIPPALNNPTSVSAGYWHTCAIDADGVRCWGKNTKGQTNVPALSNPVQVAAGRDYTCALDDNGVHCWGINGSGQTNVPALVNPQSISLSVNHACAVDQTGVVCWGKNNAGQLNVPTLTSPQLTAVGVAYSCTLDSGSVLCWGDLALNNVGQTTVPVLSNPVSLDAGLAHTCALDSTGVQCWGRKALVKVPVLSFTHP